MSSFINVLQGLAFQGIATQQFTSNGTYTPNADMLFCWVVVIGAGGAGGSTGDTTGDLGNCGSGGQGGGLAMQIYSRAEIGASQSVTIGSGGTAVTAANGNPGGTTSFGALISITGGAGGTTPTATGGSTVRISFPLTDGSVTTGTVLYSAGGGAGGFGVAIPSDTPTRWGWGGLGGYTPWLGGARQTARQGAGLNGGIAGLTPGGGGGGAISLNDAGNANGGAGARGEIFIIEFLRS